MIHSFIANFQLLYPENAVHKALLGSHFMMVDELFYWKAFSYKNKLNFKIKLILL